MKKRILTICAIASTITLAAHSAIAAGGTSHTTGFISDGDSVTFNGKITQMTCNLVPATTLGGDKATSISFPGDISPNSHSDVDFYLSVASGSTTSDACGLAATNGLSITWTTATGTWDEDGKIHSANAGDTGPSDAYLVFHPEASTDTGVAVIDEGMSGGDVKSNTTLKYKPLAKDFKGVKYHATLQAGHESGNFSVGVSYTVAYL